MLLFKIYFLVCLFKQFTANEEADDLTSKPESAIEMMINEIERIAIDAEKSRRQGVTPVEDTEKLYENIARSLGDLTDIITSNNTFIFFKLNGVDRVIISNIRTRYVYLREQLLNFIKTLFTAAPSTTNTLLPNNIVDMLLDVFENDANLALKAHALDILYLWLPNNPKLQARVMKLKGLEPFYKQISKLDSGVVFKLLELFNTILEEHLTARNKDQRNRDDYEQFRTYQTIGLLERMSTATVCDGLLHIFRAAVSLSQNADEILVPVFKLMKNIRPFCMKLFKGKTSAVYVFEDILKYVRGRKDSDFEAIGLNYLEIDLLLNDYYVQLSERFTDEL